MTRPGVRPEDVHGERTAGGAARGLPLPQRVPERRPGPQLQNQRTPAVAAGPAREPDVLRRQGSAAGTPSQPREPSAGSAFALGPFGAIHGAMSRVAAVTSSWDSTPPLRVQYPRHFRVLATALLAVSSAWVVNYLTTVLPAIESHKTGECEQKDDQLSHNAKMLFFYFVWFAVARTSLFQPRIARRVAVVQSRTHGFCRTYLVHLLIRDGPLYIFVVGSLLFWFHLWQSPMCTQRSHELYHALKFYAVNSVVLSAICAIFSFWHNKLLMEAMRNVVTNERHGAPPDTINQLKTIVFEEGLFGDEEGKSYPAECAICLGSFEAEDVIKVTPCQHAFHQECLGNWLLCARTCALCRTDLTKRSPSTPRAGTSEQQEPTRPIHQSHYGRGRSRVLRSFSGVNVYGIGSANVNVNV